MLEKNLPLREIILRQPVESSFDSERVNGLVQWRFSNSWL
jgi:hypothetical protein